MIPVFYTPPEDIVNDTLTIDGEEAHHVAKVMRLKKGDAIDIVDGLGKAHHCRISRVEKGIVTCEIYQRTIDFGEPWHFVTLAAGLSAGMKFEEVIERCTGLGISRFIPLITEKSKVKIDSEAVRARKQERWRKVAIAAMKQTRRSRIPSIEPPILFGELFRKFADPGRLLLFDPSGNILDFSQIVFDGDDKNYTIIVGPESGFSPGEIGTAREEGAHIISLGKRILRTENAGPSAAAIIMNQLGEFK